MNTSHHLFSSQDLEVITLILKLLIGLGKSKTNFCFHVSTQCNFPDLHEKHSCTYKEGAKEEFRMVHPVSELLFKGLPLSIANVSSWNAKLISHENILIFSAIVELFIVLCCVYLAMAMRTAHFGVTAVHHLTTIRSTLHIDALVSEYYVLHVSSTHVLLHFPLDSPMINHSMLCYCYLSVMCSKSH